MNLSKNQITIIIMIVGGLMMISPIISIVNTSIFISQANIAEGKVIKLVDNKSFTDDHHSVTTWSPVVEYETRSGEKVTFKSHLGNSDTNYRVGQKVEVLYTNSTPRKSMINAFANLWGVQLIQGIIGLVLFLSALGVRTGVIED